MCWSRADDSAVSFPPPSTSCGIKGAMPDAMIWLADADQRGVDAEFHHPA